MTIVPRGVGGTASRAAAGSGRRAVVRQSWHAVGSAASRLGARRIDRQPSDPDDFFALVARRRHRPPAAQPARAMNTMAPAFFPPCATRCAASATTADTRALVISSTGKHFCAGMALDVFAGDDALLVTATARDAAGLPGDAAQPDRLLQRARRGALPGRSARSRAAASAARSTWRPRATSASAAPTPSSRCRRSTIGMAADLGVLQRLPKIVPQGIAREMAYTGERLGAERALGGRPRQRGAARRRRACSSTRWRWRATSPPSRRWRSPAASSR